MLGRKSEGREGGKEQWNPAASPPRDVCSLEPTQGSQVHGQQTLWMPCAGGEGTASRQLGSVVGTANTCTYLTLGLTCAADTILPEFPTCYGARIWLISRRRRAFLLPSTAHLSQTRIVAQTSAARIVSRIRLANGRRRLGMAVTRSCGLHNQTTQATQDRSKPPYLATLPLTPSLPLSLFDHSPHLTLLPKLRYWTRWMNKARPPLPLPPSLLN
ncbi:hypothetical protein LX36DRAFT_95551 [Colletotrichum falcatum]|nr:hypothetical protein LX36DRAFT_95551 [Colletotrichum falcatum]